MSAEKHSSLSLALKTLWGATEMPFGPACAEAFRHPAFEEVIHRLLQMCELSSSGLLYGPHGVGKSYLCAHLLGKLPEKRFKSLCLAHSSLSSSDLLRSLCLQLGIEPHMRRSDNVAKLQAAFAQLGSRWPVLVLEEAQNLSALALEEIRLLACGQQDTRAPFSLLLIGDESLLARLRMGVNRALLSRLSFCQKLDRLEPSHAREYIAARLRACAINSSVFDPPALDLLIQAGDGLPRTLNHLARAALQEAADANTEIVRSAQIQRALDRLPWVASPTRA
jgi:general secretion pathway protein A